MRCDKNKQTAVREAAAELGGCQWRVVFGVSVCVGGGGGGVWGVGAISVTVKEERRWELV